MPLYEYICTACEHEFEELSTMLRRDTNKTCPQCGRSAVERKLSAIATPQAAVNQPAPPCPPCGKSDCCMGGACRL